jgi:hypothetical protein
MKRNLHNTLRSLLGIFMVLLAWNGWGQTTPCNAPSISTGCTAGSVSDGTINIGPDCMGNALPANERWYSFTPTTTGYFDFTSPAVSGRNQGFAIYSGSPSGNCDVSSMENIVCVESFGNGAAESVSPIYLVGGVTYYIQIFLVSGTQTVSICISPITWTVSNPSTCTTTSFYDPGGPGGTAPTSSTTQPGNYSNNTEIIYTFCSNDPLYPYVSVTFNSFQLESGIYDYLSVIDGSDMSGINLATYTSTQLASGTTFTSSTGCLTFYFTSDISVVAAGWDATVTCVADPGVLPEPTSADCLGAIGLCSDGSISTQGSLTGNYGDLNAANQGCLRGEHNSVWYYVVVADADGDPNTSGTGTFGFTLTYPSQYEYDYAVWGPLSGSTPEDFCTPNSPPTRCSYARNTGNSNTVTGLNGTSDTDQTYEYLTSDDGYVYWYDDVSDGDVFLILIDEYFGLAHDYTFDFIGTASQSGGLDCSVTLPIELYDFNAMHITSRYNLLNWFTASEINSDRFQIERSKDGLNWEIIGTLNAAGNSSSLIGYSFKDYGYHSPISYYRIKMIDTDGQFKFSPTRAVSSDMKISGLFSDIFPNPANESFYMIYGGGNSEESIEVNIVSMNGSVVFENVLSNISKSQGIEIPTGSLANGMYQVIIRQGDYQEVKKVSIIH